MGVEEAVMLLDDIQQYLLERLKYLQLRDIRLTKELVTVDNIWESCTIIKGKALLPQNWQNWPPMLDNATSQIQWWMVNQIKHRGDYHAPLILTTKEFHLIFTEFSAQTLTGLLNKEPVHRVLFTVHVKLLFPKVRATREPKWV